jgi:hypothetical protein
VDETLEAYACAAARACVHYREGVRERVDVWAEVVNRKKTPPGSQRADPALQLRKRRFSSAR